jgi:hypothetical protein
VNGFSEAAVTSAVQMLRGVVAGFPQLSQAKFGVIYNCARDHGAPGFDSYDWVGCDNFQAGCNALEQLTANFPIPANSTKRYMIVPGGSFGQNPDCFVTRAQRDPQVVAVVPFMWQSDPSDNPGIRDDAGQRSAYCQAGRTLTGQQPGPC